MDDFSTSTTEPTSNGTLEELLNPLEVSGPAAPRAALTPAGSDGVHACINDAAASWQPRTPPTHLRRATTEYVEANCPWGLEGTGGKVEMRKLLQQHRFGAIALLPDVPTSRVGLKLFAGKRKRERKAPSPESTEDEQEDGKDEDVVDVMPRKKEPCPKPRKAEPKKALGEGMVGSLLRNVGSYKVESGMIKQLAAPIEEMVDLTEHYRAGRYNVLYQFMREQGYLLIRDLIPSHKVMAARCRVITHLDNIGARDEEGHIATRKGVGWTVHTPTGDVTAGMTVFADEDEHKAEWRATCRSDEVQTVAASAEVQHLLAMLALTKEEEESEGVRHGTLLLNPSYTWLRVKGTKECTPEHMEYYYYRTETDLYAGPLDPLELGVEGGKEPRRLTPDDIKCCVCDETGDGGNELLQCSECPFAQHLDCQHDGPYTLPDVMPHGEWYCHSCSPQPLIGAAWIPLIEVGPEQSTLCVQPGSHMTTGLERDYRGRVPASWYRSSKGKAWATTTFSAGDVVLLDLKIVHARSTNWTRRFCLSLDTRWMLKPHRENWGKTRRSCFAEAASRNEVDLKDLGGERGKGKSRGGKEGSDDEDDDDVMIIVSDSEEEEGEEEGEEPREERLGEEDADEVVVQVAGKEVIVIDDSDDEG